SRIMGGAARRHITGKALICFSPRLRSPENLNMAHELRPYQRLACDGLYDFWQSGGGNGLIVIPTGGGKSLILATICRELLAQWPTLRIGVITHVRELIKQNVQELITE